MVDLFKAPAVMAGLGALRGPQGTPETRLPSSASPLWPATNWQVNHLLRLKEFPNLCPACTWRLYYRFILSSSSYLLHPSSIIPHPIPVFKL